MRRALIPTSLLILAGLAVSASARDLFVHNVAGDDRRAGISNDVSGDMDGAVRTIGRALRLAASSDRIVLAKTDVPYNESISLVGSRHSGWAQQPFILLGNGATLDGTSPVPPDAWQYVRGHIFRFRPRELGYQELYLEGRPATLVACAADADLDKLEPQQWALLDGAIYFCVEHGNRPESYALSWAEKPTGITLCHVEYVAIVDLVVQGFRLDGIHATNGARQVRLQSVMSRGNGRCGVVVGGASQVTLDSCTVGDNRFAQLLTLPTSETRLNACDLPRLTAPAWVDQGGRVYLDQRPIQGGREEILAEPAPEKPAAEQPAP